MAWSHFFSLGKDSSTPSLSYFWNLRFLMFSVQSELQETWQSHLTIPRNSCWNTVLITSCIHNWLHWVESCKAYIRCLGKAEVCQKLSDKPNENSGASHFSDALGAQWPGVCWDSTSKVKMFLHLTPPTLQENNHNAGWFLIVEVTYTSLRIIINLLN